MTNGRAKAARWDSTTERQGDVPLLDSVLVRYSDAPNRRTVYPPGLSGVARMSTWLTADADAFVDLEAAR